MRAGPLLALLPALAAAESSSQLAAANPIRKVVTILQKMQEKTQAEGAREQDLYQKFGCFCKGGAQRAQTAIDSAARKIPELKAAILDKSDIKLSIENAKIQTICTANNCFFHFVISESASKTAAEEVRGHERDRSDAQAS